MVVVGISNAVPREHGEVIARIATDAALKHWNRTLDDRRLFTKAATQTIRRYPHNQAA